jgi:hypothetical protein
MGTALEKMTEDGKWKCSETVYDHSKFFRTLDSMMSLNKLSHSGLTPYMQEDQSMERSGH